MCRLFAFRSSQPHQVHRSLVAEKNSLQVQSNEHKDGWGIAYYTSNTPELAKGVGPAHVDPEFDRVSRLVNAHTVLAHVRLASVGPVKVENAHPFHFGQWTFAHNGTIQGFAHCQAEIEARIAPAFHPYIQGDTDSERCFYLFLTQLQPLPGGLETPTLSSVMKALAQTMRVVKQLADCQSKDPSSMNFIATNGQHLAASRCNRSLFFSEWKTKAAHEHQEPMKGSVLKHLVIASEKLCSEDHWHEVAEGELIGVDDTLHFTRARLEDLIRA